MSELGCSGEGLQFQAATVEWARSARSNPLLRRCSNFVTLAVRKRSSVFLPMPGLQELRPNPRILPADMDSTCGRPSLGAASVAQSVAAVPRISICRTPTVFPTASPTGPFLTRTRRELPSSLERQAVAQHLPRTEPHLGTGMVALLRFLWRVLSRCDWNAKFLSYGGDPPPLVPRRKRAWTAASSSAGRCVGNPGVAEKGEGPLGRLARRSPSGRPLSARQTLIFQLRQALELAPQDRSRPASLMRSRLSADAV